MRHVMRALGLVCLLGATAAAAGCGGLVVCDQSEATTGLVIRVVDAEGPAEQPRPGRYALTVTTELGALTWTCEVPADATDASACATEQALYGEDAEGEANARALLVSAYVDDDGFTLAFRLIESNTWTGPEDVDIAVERDGEVVAEEHYAPKYEVAVATAGGKCPVLYAASGEPPTLAL